ncbi:MAG: hydrogenase maturation protease [Sphingobacteriia bacterium]|nr:hydrogenase maturation protease [Sphingobacteriia bacterium]NCC39680.1 hydrogenase maturation protease [Gammaproteobacteria bacterium]
MSAAPRTLIIGYGSPIRGDDAIGPLVAERLRGVALGDQVRIIARHILTAELTADLIDHERAIFLDAALSGTPGEVRCHRLAPARECVSTMAHFLDPRELLAWCETLYGQVPEAYLVTACGDSFDYADYRLSAAGTAAIEPMIAWVQRLIDGDTDNLDTPLGEV